MKNITVSQFEQIESRRVSESRRVRPAILRFSVKTPINKGDLLVNS